MKKFIIIIHKAVIILIYAFILLILFDFILFRQILKIGMPFLDNLGTKSYRIPAAYTGFILDSIMEGQNSYDKVKFFKSNNDTLKIAFFGGSTGQYLDEEYLNKKFKEYFKQDVELRNLSCSSSNHRQHLHMMLEILPKYNPDIIVFYGGANELIQPLWYDPRPGYPYNFYYKSETSPLKQFLIENSAIISDFEFRKRKITSYLKLREEYKPASESWCNNIINKYFETLKLSNNLARTLDSVFYGKTKFIAFYQPYNIDLIKTEGIINEDIDFYAFNESVRNEIKKYNYIVDVHDEFNKFNSDIWDDYCHVKFDSGANEHIIDVIAKITAQKFAKKK